MPTKFSRLPHGPIPPLQQFRLAIVLIILLTSLVTLALSISFAATLKPSTPVLPTKLNFTSPANTSATSSVNVNVTLPLQSRYAEALTTPSNSGYLSRNDHGINSTDQGSLVYYTATLPVVSIAHSAVEAYIALYHPKSLSHGSSALTSALLVLGWGVNNAFWTYCDVLTGKYMRGRGICPPELARRPMEMDHKLGVAKNVFGWIVLGAYLVFVGIGVWSMVRLRMEKELKRPAGEGEDEEVKESDEMSVNTVTGRED